MTRDTPLLSVQDITKTYGGRIGCADVSFDLWPGEVMGIVGESGSGKSTLLSCLAGHLTPDTGRVVFDTRSEGPRDVLAMSEPERRMLARTDWAFVHQNPRDGLRLGVSTHGYAEMLRADAVQPSYIALGAVFPTTLKRMATVPQGMARLAAYVALLRDYPTVAIGGIGPEQFADVLATGVGSIAVVRALVNAPDPEAAAAQLLQAMQKQ